MEKDASQPILGKIINGRYKITQVLGVGTVRKIYTAEDTWLSLSDNPQFIIKHFQPKGKHYKRWEVCKRLFSREVEALKKLVLHDQLPQVLNTFKDKEGYYLVQEFIVGKPLRTELPIGEHSSKLWSEKQCIELLQDILGILEFIHSQGIIHGNINPSHLIRRTSNGKIVLIDFAAAYQIESNQAKPRVVPIKASIAPSAIPPLGYLPAEQLSGQPCFSSDLYALGLIAIQALTGLNLGKLKANYDTGEINWQQQISVSKSLAEVLDKMVRYDFKDRYQSAADVLNILYTLPIKSENRDMEKEENQGQFLSEYYTILQPPIYPTDEDLSQGLHTVTSKKNTSITQPSLPVKLKSSDSSQKENNARQFARACWPKLPPLLTGLGVGIAASNAIVISFGIYYLLNTFPTNPGIDILAKAKEQYQAGNFEKAIDLAESIPSDNPAYQESLNTRQKWRDQWHTAVAQFQAVEEAFNEGRWRDVMKESRAVPNITYWQKKIQPFIEQTKPELEEEAQKLLQQAYHLAAQKDFSSALAVLKQIPRDTPTGGQIYPKLVEYSHKQDIRAELLLQKAYQLAAVKNFSAAMKYLSEIPEEAPAYETAQLKLAEYFQKQDFKEELQKQAKLNTNLPKEQIKQIKSPKSTKASKATPDLNPGNQLQEVTSKTVQSKPTVTSKTVQSKPTVTPKTVQAKPTVTPKTVQAKPTIPPKPPQTTSVKPQPKVNNSKPKNQ
ncbi:MAG: protein kinase [Potamolinea sp.]